MKRVVKKIECDQVDLSSINDDDFVGIDWGNNGKKSKVLSLRGGDFVGIGIDDVNLSSHWIKKSKREYIEKAMEQDGVIIYLFKTANELNKWFYNNNN